MYKQIAEIRGQEDIEAVRSELVSALQLVPTFESLQLVYSAITEDCRAYYEAKTGITPTSAFSGPLVSGTTV